MNTKNIIPHLFRTEYRKIVAVLIKRFGYEQLEIAEDIASDTFLTATHSWGLQGIPENPTAWLYYVAKNKAKNYIQRSAIFENKIVHEIKRNASTRLEPEIDLSPQNINDSQLHMMFAVCHPAVSPEAQIALSLRILCGFGIEEIADAFLTTKDIINKRLYRAKERLREEKVKIELIPTEVDERLHTVLTTIYLLFNEGYYSISQNETLRRDFCLEAIRLCTMLVENELTDKPEVNALLALMCFHFSRFDSRMAESGDLILYEDQDTTLWNADLISKGGYFLKRAASGNNITRYHLEAGIAYWSTQKMDTPEKWEHVLQLYNQLLRIAYSPMAALNRTYALSKANGKQAALVEAEKLNLINNHFYYLLLGDLYTDTDHDKARMNLQKALAAARTEKDKQVVENKIQRLSDKSSLK